jgi:hypothetical protein
MTRKQTSKRHIQGIMGAALLIVGSTVLVAYSAALAWRFHVALNSASLNSFGFFGSVGLASLHAVRLVALDHAVLLSVARRILVLCSALIVMLIGIARVLKHGRHHDASAPPKGGGAWLVGRHVLGRSAVPDL